MHPSGAQHELRFDDQRVCVVEIGGGLRTYSARGRAVIDGYRADEMCRSFRGLVLAPWPNRLAAGHYSFEGTEHQLPITDPSTGSAIHGLVLSANWELLERADDRVALEHVLHPQPGYPFALRLRVEYGLDATGLRVATSAENIGDRACPFGLGHHPYIVGAPTVDDLVLQIPSRSPGDFREPRAIGSTVLDTTYSQLERDADGRVRVRIGDTTLWADESYGYLQLFTGDPLPDVARRSLAVEPMTCPPNAFQTGEGLIRLEPGARFEGCWGLEP